MISTVSAVDVNALWQGLTTGRHSTVFCVCVFCCVVFVCLFLLITDFSPAVLWFQRWMVNSKVNLVVLTHLILH